MSSLDDSKKAQVEALRKLILDAEPNLQEHIKWNAPSYVFGGEDRITFNLFNKEEAVKLILHMGAMRKEDKNAAPVLKDDTGLIVWSSDIRGILSFRNLEDIQTKSIQLGQIIKQWLAVKQ